MRKLLICSAALSLLLSACAYSADKAEIYTDKPNTEASIVSEKTVQNEMEESKVETEAATKLLGGISPEEALEYMKSTPALVIVQVNTAEWKIEPGFDGALWIPHDEMAERYDEIPADRPVLLHCGGGIVSVPAYETLIEKRPDIPELCYIAGSPHGIIDKYNDWKKNGGE